MNRGSAWALTPRQLLAAGVLTVAIILSAPWVAPGIDWLTVLRPATLRFFSLGNPYELEGTFSPPWLFILLGPIAVLPAGVGGVAIFWLCLGTWVTLARKFASGGILSVLAVVTSPMVVNGLLARNVDFLVMWGLLLPPEIAVYFLMIKPQVGGAALAYLALQEYRQRGLGRVVRIFAAPCLVTLMAFVAYGLRLSDAKEAIALPWNASPWTIIGWPSVLIGMCVMAVAIMRKDPRCGSRISMAATPFFSPYVGSQSWVSILPAVMNSKALYVIWVIGWGWIAYVLIR